MQRKHYFKIILWMGICSFGACSDDTIESTIDTKEWNIDANIDATYAPGDDFFMYCNGTWYKNLDLGNNHFIGTHLSNEVTNDERIASLNDEPIFKKLESDILAVDQTTEYAYASINKNIEELTADIKTKEDAWIAIGKAMQKGYQTYFQISFIGLDGVLCPIFQPMRNLKVQTIQGVQQTLMKMGVNADRAAKDAETIVAMRKKLDSATSHRDLSMKNFIKHPELHEQLVMFSSVKTRADGGDVLTTILKQLDIEKKHVVVGNDLVDYLNVLSQMTVDEIKSVLTYDIIDLNVYMASSRDLEEFNASQNAAYTFKDISDAVKYTMKYTQSHAYATRYATAQQQAKWMEICEELRATFKERINNLDWMSTTTKGRAIEKLEAMIFNVGYPDHWISEGLPTFDECKSLVEDVMQVRQANYKLTKYFIGKSVKDESFNYVAAFGLGLTSVNASYYPTFNSLYIYPALMLPPIYDEKASDAMMYACATVLAHEMTHGFDNIGAMFDKVGNYKNWWTVSDQMDFLAKQQQLADCYNRLEIMPDKLPGVYADGTYTLRENIADQGGVMITHQCYMTKLKQQGYTGNELIKQEKRFFQAYANYWSAKYTPYYAQLMRETDTHSLPRERINGVMMNCDRWYELYNVKWGDHLYLRPEKRSHIW